VALEEALEGAAGDAEGLGGLGHVARGLAQRAGDGLPLVAVGDPTLGFGQRDAVFGRGRGRGERLEGGKIAGVDHGLGGEGDGPLDDVLELADVPRPRVRDQGVEGGLSEALGRAAVAGPVLCEEVAGQQGDILGTLPQRRHLDGDDVEAVVEVLAERAGVHAGLWVAVGGGEDADVDVDGGGGADAGDLALLDDPQELDLGAGAELGELVEEDRAAAGGLEVAGAGGHRACEGAALVAE